MTESTVKEDPGLAALLSRLAALQGQAVPTHRFAMLERTDSGVALGDLDRLPALARAGSPDFRRPIGARSPPRA
jgi:hypothetical protein